MKLYILCVDDEKDILEAVENDLAPLEEYFHLELANTTSEAESLIKKIQSQGDRVAVLFCDHLMPQENGVELLVRLHKNLATQGIRKVLLTGQAGLDATIRAINEAGLKHYVSKPWDAQELVRIAKNQMTEYILEEGIDPGAYMPALDHVRLSHGLRRGQWLSDA